MVNGIKKSWKQPVAYYFTKDCISTENLKLLIKEIINLLQGIGFKVLATVCDQGSTNRAAIKELKKASLVSDFNPYFIVNSDKIFTIFDPCHLLKCTRNAFFKYIIHFCGNKMAKLSHVKSCFAIDKCKRFQGLHRIREAYFNIHQRSQMKMKVSVAAKIFSNTLASAIESMIGVNYLPSEAIQTAEFLHDMDCIFDSFNGRSPRPEKGKKFRRSMSLKSPHRELWLSLLPKIESWVFESNDKKNKRTLIPFKAGWIIKINATLQLFEVCSRMGFKYLKTRSLNQDPLENSFGSLRSYGAGNDNPSCYQFIGLFKTSILNNLTDLHSHKRNCEKDEGSILDNLQTFLESDNQEVPLEIISESEFKDVQIPFNSSDDSYDLQISTYVTGFLVKKLKITNCNECAANLITDIVGPDHIFTMFKEHSDNKKRLIYPTEKIVQILIRIYDIIMYILPNYGHVSNITQKLKTFVKKYVNFDWFSCKNHLDIVFNDFLHYSICLVVRKFCDNINRAFQEVNRKKYIEKKMKKIQHL